MTTIVRPISTVLSQNCSQVPSGTAQAVTSDGNLSTYVQFGAFSSGLAKVILQFHSFTIPAGFIVRRVRANLYLESTGPGRMNTIVGIQNAAGVNTPFDTYTANLPAFTLLNGAWRTSSPTGNQWTQADMSALRVIYHDDNTGATLPQLAEAYLEIDTNALPTVVVNDPTGTITVTTRPVVDWTYSDSDHDAQAAYQVRVFTHAVWSAGGFNPATSTAVIDSGVVFSSSTDYQPTVDLANDANAYRAYVQVYEQLDGRNYASAWAFTSFTQTVTYPVAPTLTATPQPSSGRTLLSLSGNDVGYPGSWAGFTLTGTIEYSDDAGATWNTVRYGEGVVLDGSEDATLYDYEAPTTAREYRARIVAFQSPYTLAGPNCAPVTASLSTPGWWLKDPFNTIAPLGDSSGVLAFTANPRTITERGGVFAGLGRENPITISDTVGGQDGGLTIQALAGSVWPQLLSLLRLPWALLLVDDFGEQQYIRLSPARSWDISAAAAGPARTVTLTYLEADRP